MTNKGKFKYLLGIDCETTGLCFSSDSPVHNPTTGEQHQAVSWGILVIESSTLEVVDELYVEIQWNHHSLMQRTDDPNFGAYAERIHGLDLEHLQQHGMPEEEACLQIGSLISKYWSPATSIVTLGHNVHLFDVPFLRGMFRSQDIELRLNNRHVDTNSIGYANWETYNSDDLFETLGYPQRAEHNALDDIKLTLGVVQTTRAIMQSPSNQKLLARIASTNTEEM